MSDIVCGRIPGRKLIVRWPHGVRNHVSYNGRNHCPPCNKTVSPRFTTHPVLQDFFLLTRLRQQSIRDSPNIGTGSSPIVMAPQYPPYRIPRGQPGHGYPYNSAISGSASSSVYSLDDPHEGVHKANVQLYVKSPDLVVHDSQTPQGKKALFGSNLPILRRARSTLGKTSLPQKSKPDDKNGRYAPVTNNNESASRPSKFNDPFDLYEGPNRYGVEVSIVGGINRPRKASFAERAAKFGRDALPDGRLARKLSISALRDGALAKPRNVYTAVKDMRQFGQGSERSEHGSSESLTGFPETAYVMEGGAICDNVNQHVAPALPPKTVRQRSPGLSERATQKSSTTESARMPLDEVSADVKNTLHSRDIAMPTHVSERTPSQPRRWIDSDDPNPTVMESTQHKQGVQSHFSWTTYAESVWDEAAEAQSVHQKMQQAVQPGTVSRFSWSTIATDATGTTWQQDSYAPTPRSRPWPSQQEANSNMTRRRPVPGSRAAQMTGNTTDYAHHNPQVTKHMAGSRGERPVSPVSTIDKALPPPPTDASQNTHVDALQTQSNQLDLRVSNMQRIMDEMLKVDKASPLEVSEKSRRENRKKLDLFQADLEAVQHERHEVGMALARARVRLDRERGEESSLWLRRVAG